MTKLKAFIFGEPFPGVLLIFCTLLALVCQNSSLEGIYHNFLYSNFGFIFKDFELIKPLLYWINDGLIAIFFLYIGLELKYEILKGQLQNVRSVSLPIFGALGGMIVPALIFALINFHDKQAMAGWAIPTATDIAFAVGIVILLGNKIPSSLKLFLLSLAIFDDLGAIVIIALFYTSELSAFAMVFCALCILALYLLNHFHVSKYEPYIIIGCILWIAMLKSGVHATLAGVIVAAFIPLQSRKEKAFLKPLYNVLEPWIHFFILPLFAFANAGVDLSQMQLGALFSPVSLGIFLGLFVGKQVGVFIFSYVSIKLKLAKLPENVSYKQFYGICILTGIGFTMSLFIDGLAYRDPNLYAHADRLAILLASFTSALIAYIYLNLLKNPQIKATNCKD
ncbi:Na+/H+ antiporter NhaA [Campylobacter sp. MIT 99-7217]|uniref:Na+/H+ antiporter NhaA n=1 Tax=Campylobacter sp. MIT 99-7217 TaxID=535091 RepID=UPI00115ABFB3|nr:Na+/H+ antiporter NhaA [Campylobacter sp. MIT 99-7217]TQR30940.1 Na+/H+ antiporter NhaA [Campylobacter sp. MIT 99-7217]